MQIPERAAFLRAPGSANDHDLGLFEIGTGRAPDRPEHPGLYHLAWEVGTLADLADTRAKLVAAGALVGESDHRVSKSLYAKDPSGIEFEVMWRVPAEDWAAEMATADGAMILPLDLEAAIARWGQDQVTGPRRLRPPRPPCSRPGAASSPAGDRLPSPPAALAPDPQPGPLGPDPPVRSLRSWRAGRRAPLVAAVRAAGQPGHCCARPRPRWYCWPITSSPPRRSPPASPPRCGGSVRGGRHRPGRDERALHGGASLGARPRWPRPAAGCVPRVVAELLRQGEGAGFGLRVRGGDPRATVLLDLERRAAPKSGQLAVADAVLAKVRQKALPEPNIDVAIAILARVAGMVRAPARRFRGGQDRGLDRPCPRGRRRARTAAPTGGLHRQARGRRPVTTLPARTDWRHSPVVPSIRSRSRSAWPRCRAYSSIMCR